MKRINCLVILICSIHTKAHAKNVLYMYNMWVKEILTLLASYWYSSGQWFVCWLVLTFAVHFPITCKVFYHCNTNFKIQYTSMYHTMELNNSKTLSVSLSHRDLHIITILNKIYHF
jgi:hypothetical protein